MSVEHATMTGARLNEMADTIEAALESEEAGKELRKIVERIRLTATQLDLSIESLPSRIAELAAEYYTADDKVLDQEKECKRIEAGALKIILEQKDTTTGRPLHSSESKRKEAVRSYLEKDQEYFEARELLQKLCNARNACLVELEEARNILAVRQIAAKRELIAAWQVTMEHDRKEGVK